MRKELDDTQIMMNIHDRYMDKSKRICTSPSAHAAVHLEYLADETILELQSFGGAPAGIFFQEQILKDLQLKVQNLPAMMPNYRWGMNEYISSLIQFGNLRSFCYT